VVILHEIIHEIYRKKIDGFMLKMNFEKDYNKIKWPFMQQTLCMKGFDPKWGDWMDEIVQRGCVGIRARDDIGHYFQTQKKIRQAIL
jgi:hypothetical protein